MTNRNLKQFGVFSDDLHPDVRVSAVWAVVNYTVPSNYSTPQTVTVTPVDDLIADGNITYSIITAPAVSTDPFYSGWNPDDVTVTNNDNDTSGIVVSPTSLTTTEGGSSAQFTVKLSSQPTANVTVGVSSSDTTEGTVSPSSLTFLAGYDGPGSQSRVPTALYSSTGGTWVANPSSLSLVQCVDDNPANTDPTVKDAQYITSPLNAAGGNILFSYSDFEVPSSATITSVTVYFRARDNGSAGTNDIRALISIGGNLFYGPAVNPGTSFGLGGYTWNYNPIYGAGSQVPWTVDQINGGGYAPRWFGVYSADLNPSVDVSCVWMQVSYNYTVAPTWNVPQTVTVSPVDDLIDDDNVAYSINLTATGGDYAGKTASVSVTNNDNDTAGITVNPTSGLITTEAGGTATFTIKLNTQPTANVTIGLSSSDTTEGTVSPSSLTFTPSDWSSPKTVTVTGVDDSIVDGDINYTIITAPATSADPKYNGLNAPDVSVKNTDNDVANAPPVATNVAVSTNEDTAKSITLTATDANGDPLTYAIVSSPSNGSLGSVVGNQVTYTPNANWHGTDTFTFKANDGKADSNIATVTVTVTPVNDAPVATAQSVSTAEDTAKAITLAGTDVDGDPIVSYAIVTGPSNGSLSGAAPNLTYTPAADFNGADSFTFTVSDGTMVSAPATVSITVTEVNDAPTANADSKSTDQDVPLVFPASDLVANDSVGPDNESGQTLIVTAVSSPVSGTVGLSGGTITFTPAAGFSGAASFVYTVTDNGTTNGAPDPKTANGTVNVTVNAAANSAPVLTPIGNKTVAELTALTFTATATDADLPAQTLTFSLDATSVAAGMTINGSTGAFSWTPTEAQGPGNYTVTIRVTDNGSPNLYDEETITIAVNEVNVAPTLIGVPATATIPELALYTFDADASDADLPAQTLTFSLVGAPAGAAINSETGVFAWTPTESQGPGTYNFSVRVSDGLANTDSAISLTVTEVNVAPVLGAIGNKTVDELTALTFTATATDADLPAQTLTFSLDAASIAAGMTINSSTGAFSWTPTEAQGGSDYPVTITVTDNGTPVLSDTETITIAVNKVNVAPVLGAIGNKTVDELTTLTFTAIATDADLPAQTLTFSLDGASVAAGMTINGSTGAFSWTPTEAQGPGNYTVTIRVTDNGSPNLYDEETITIAVDEVNVAPILIGVPATATIPELALYTFDADASDADLPAQTLTFSLVGAPAGAAINSETGVFTWTPTESQGPGTYNFSVRVSDGLANTDSAISLTVTEVNVAPVLGAIGNQTVDELTALTFTATATDADLPAQTLTFSLVGAPTGAAIGSVSGAFSWTPTEAQGPASYTFDVVVSDGDLSGSETITVTVSEVNSAPVLGAIGDKSVEWGNALSFALSATDSDIPANTLTYSISAGELPGMVINPSTGAFSWTPTSSQVGAHSVTFAVTDNGVPALTDSETIVIQVEKRSTTLVYTGDLREQYSDVASLSATLADAASGAKLADKPVVFTFLGHELSPVNTNTSGVASATHVVTDPAGTSYLVISSFAGDATYKPSSDQDGFEVLHENITGSLQSDTAYKTQPGVSYTDTLTLTVWIKEAYNPATGEPNGEPLAQPGDIGLAQVTSCRLEPVTGSPIVGTIKSVETVTGSGYAGYRIVTCEFTTDIPVNTYSLVVPVTGDYYSGTYESVIVIYDPSLGFTTGGGWFYWPTGTAHPELEGVKTNFGYTMKYNKKGANVQGSFLLIAHLPDGGLIRLKSNAIYGLAILNGTYPGEASFSGKCVYTRLDADGTVLAEAGNQEFTVYVKDMNEPGTGTDMFWFTTKLTISGELPFTLDSNANNRVDEGECVPLGGGNIVVPHSSASGGGGDDETGGTTPPGQGKKK